MYRYCSVADPDPDHLSGFVTRVPSSMSVFCCSIDPILIPTCTQPSSWTLKMINSNQYRDLYLYVWCDLIILGKIESWVGGVKRSTLHQSTETSALSSIVTFNSTVETVGTRVYFFTIKMITILNFGYIPCLQCLRGTLLLDRHLPDLCSMAKP